MNKVARTGRLINVSEIPNYSSLLSSRGLSTGSSNKSYKYSKFLKLKARFISLFLWIPWISHGMDTTPP
ncbi:hypothetical protein [Rickettsia tamurae]|uniref:hypothetical protein n=1 Tax=Rickettsia tamurae TaxID=334545 RepID=UPI001BFDE8D4|nr:hypothetical protein [Rickettsia tamurae]